jgi:hypothetical protein
MKGWKNFFQSGRRGRTGTPEVHMAEIATAVEPITFTDDSAPDSLFHQYPGQNEPQQVYVELDLEDGRLEVDWDGEIGNAVPAPVYHRRVLRWYLWKIPTAGGSNELVEKITPLAQRVLDGASVEWDGNNMSGTFTQDAQDAIDEIEGIVDGWFDEFTARVEPVDAWDWIDGNDDDLGVTADSSDEDLKRIAEEIRSGASPETDGGYVVIVGLTDYLEEVREEARKAAREELEEVAAEIEQLRERRDEMIRAQCAWGDPVRAVAERAGMSHTNVRAIRDRDREADSK